MQNLTDFWNIILIKSKDGLQISVGDIVIVISLILIGYFLSRFAEFILAKRLSKTHLKADSVYAIKRIIFYLILVMIFMTILGFLGIPLTAFAFATGAIAIGVGFGAQNIINNFISGWILMAERPIRVNDFIEVDNITGTVKRVGTRSTLIHRLDGVDVLIPNSKLLENTVVNWTLKDGFIRNRVSVGVAYGSDLNKTMDALKRAVDSCEGVVSTKESMFTFEEFGDNALIFEIFFWCDMSNDRPMRQVRSDVRFAISRELEKDDIVIAYPQRDIHVYQDRPFEVSMKKA